MTPDEINRLARIPLSDHDLLKILGENAKIILYGDIDNYKKIEDMLPKSRDYVIILVGVTDSENGHWQCIYRFHDNIMMFDSYGDRPDKALEWAPQNVRKKMDQEMPHLSVLLNDSVDDGFHVTFNSYPYQDKDDKTIATCGRFCSAFIQYCKDSKCPTIEGFHKLMEEIRNKYDMKSFDAVVTRLVNYGTK
jgi:hypothetical protein